MMIRTIFLLLFMCCTTMLWAEEAPLSKDDVVTVNTIFDDKLLLEGYVDKYGDESKEILMAMIKDDSLSSYKTAAAIHVLRNKFADELVSRERRLIIQQLWRRLHRTSSAYVQVEIMYTLLKLDRYKFFNSMVKSLIQKMDHYNHVVRNMSFDYLKATLEESNRAREARLIFTTMRKVLFLSRKRLQNLSEPDEKLKQQLDLVRWSVKVLGTQELKHLPKEVIPLL